MSTADDARLAEIRERNTMPVESIGEDAYDAACTLSSDAEYLLAEVDRLTRDLVAVTEERDDYKLKSLIGEMHFEQWEHEFTALRAAHTWTVATPATMPPVGSGPWLVEWLCGDYTREFVAEGPDCLGVTRKYWVHNDADEIGIDGTRWCAMPIDAMPDEPAKEATP